MRTNRQLLEILLSSKHLLKKHGLYGLCNMTSYLYWMHQLSLEESKRLRKYISRHRPFQAYLHRYFGYFWPPGEIEPRERWLKKRIKKEKQNEKRKS